MKKILASLAMLAMAVPAMADDTVNVNIEVAETVSMWANHHNITLTLDGKNAENSDAKASSLSYLANVTADITAQVDGTLPTPKVAGGGIQFFIFNNGTEDDALASIEADAYSGKPGRFVWTQATLGTAQTVFDGLAVANSIVQLPVVYAAAAPGELPDVDNFQLTVLWTIAAE